MKKIDRFKHQLVGGALALAVMLLAARAGAETIAQVVEVLQVKGNARYSTADKHWHDLRQGDILQPGVVIQTAAHSFVDIQLSDRDTAAKFQSAVLVVSATAYTPPASGMGAGEESKANIVRIFESSVLAVDKLLVERTGVDEVAETQLDLQAGRIMGNVKKLSAASKYEIKVPNGVAGIRGSIYDISVNSALKMLSGSAILAIVAADGTVKTYVINGEHGFNPVDGVIFPLTPDERRPPPDWPPFNHRGGPPLGPPPYGPPPISPVR